MSVPSTDRYENVRSQKNSLFSFYQIDDNRRINILFTEQKWTNYSRRNNHLKVVYF